MPAPWQTWKKTLSCKADLDEVHDPKAVASTDSSKSSSSRRQRRSSSRKGGRHQHKEFEKDTSSSSSSSSSGGSKASRKSKSSWETDDDHHHHHHHHHSSKQAAAAHKQSQHHQHHVPGGSCARSLKDVIHGNTRVVHKQSCSSSSPVSHDSSSGGSGGSGGSAAGEYLNMVADDVIVGERGLLGTAGISYYCGTPLSSSYVYRGTPLRRFSSCYDCTTNLGSGRDAGYDALDRDPGSAGAGEGGHPAAGVAGAGACVAGACDSPKPACHKCGRVFGKLETLEQHLITQHAVTELNPGDSSRNVVEIIFRTSWLKKELPCGRIQRILKVHNTQRTINRFEEHRDAVKARATKLLLAAKQGSGASSNHQHHPRCVADGNELLRFYGTTLACPLGFHGSTSLCALPACAGCRIIRSGFAPAGEEGGVHTTSTSGKAHDCIPWPYDDDDAGAGAGGGGDDRGLCKVRRAMLVCRVIAGRVHMDQDNASGAGTGTTTTGSTTGPPPGFDSVSADAGPYSNMGDLVVFNARAVLPCFVVIYSV